MSSLRIGDRVSIKDTKGAIDSLKRMNKKGEADINRCVGASTYVTKIIGDGMYNLAGCGSLKFSNKTISKISNFEVGDSVTVRRDLQIGRYYGSVSFVSGMRNLLGETKNILSVVGDGEYHLEYEPERWWISDGMLEIEGVPCDSKFQIGDTVRLRDDLEVGKYYNNVKFTDKLHELKRKTFLITELNTKNRCKIGEAYPSWIDESMLEKVKKKGMSSMKRLSVEFNEKLGCYFITDGNSTICCKEFGLAVKSSNDDYCKEVGEALSYKRFREEHE